MESSEQETQDTPKTSKRALSEDEHSPTSKQQRKTLKMDITPEQFKEMMDAIKQIPEMRQQLLDDLPTIKEEMSGMRKAQESMATSLESIKERVQILEEEVQALKENPPTEQLEEVMSQIEEIQRENQILQQMKVNNVIMLRNFPIEIKSNATMMKTAVEKLLNTLELNISANDYEAHAIKVRNKNLAFIQMKFSSDILKVRVLKKFRDMKKSTANTNEPAPFLIEKLVELSIDHELNGKVLSIQNKLTRANFDLLNAARKFAPSHFEFVFDSPEGNIMIRANGHIHQVLSEREVNELVKRIDNEKKKTKSQLVAQTSGNGSKKKSSSKQ
jgi:archaellum component FlaC